MGENILQDDGQERRLYAALTVKDYVGVHKYANHMWECTHMLPDNGEDGLNSGLRMNDVQVTDGYHTRAGRP